MSEQMSDGTNDQTSGAGNDAKPAVTLNGLDEIRRSAGLDLGPTQWMEIDQERVNQFAEATGDHQWIHVDVERANRESPFGAPIAHGYLTMSLSNYFLPQMITVEGVDMGINYGTNKVRFMSPVKVGDRIRTTGKVTEVTEVAGGVQTTVVITIEVENSPKPACVIEALSRWLNNSTAS